MCTHADIVPGMSEAHLSTTNLPQPCHGSVEHCANAQNHHLHKDVAMIRNVHSL